MSVKSESVPRVALKHLHLATLAQGGDTYDYHEELRGLPFAVQESLKPFSALSPILFSSLSSDSAVEASVLFEPHLNLTFAPTMRKYTHKLSVHP